MLQEATINAQKAATQFASDSNVRLGALRSATQGTFSIEDTTHTYQKTGARRGPYGLCHPRGIGFMQANIIG